MGVDNAAAGGSSGTTSASNKLSAAMFELRKYYTMMGRGDLVQIIKEVPDDVKAAAFANQDNDMQDIMAIFEEYEATVRIPPDVIEQLMFTLMDNTEGAYFTKDLLTDTRLLSRFSIAKGADPVGGAIAIAEADDYTGINNYIMILMEPDIRAPDDEKLPFYQTTVSQQPLTPLPDNGEQDAKASLASFVNVIPPQTTTSGGADGTSTESPGFAINADPMDPNRYTNPTLSVMLFPNKKMSPQMRGAAATSLFVNAIPSIEMSRCIPYINISFVAAVPPYQTNGANQISLLRFLGMAGPMEADYDKINLDSALPQQLADEYGYTLTTPSATAEVTTDDIGEYATTLSSAGMELFTSPQTLVNPELNKMNGEGKHIYAGAAGTALDVFAPFMTLNSLKISISGLGNALHSNKTGMLSFTLHDRSRMADIAPLIATDLFSQSYLNVEWGWSHPDGDDASTNAYGALLNSMRSVGQFNIVASNFSLGNDGQVKIDMKIASRGGTELRTFPIATGNLMPVAPFKSMVAQYLAEALQKAKAVEGVTDNTLKEINTRINVSMGQASSPSSVITRQLWEDFMFYVAPGTTDEGKTPDSFSELLKTLVGDPTADAETRDAEGAISVANATLASEAKRKITQLSHVNDPFWPAEIPVHVQESINDLADTDKDGNIINATAGFQSLGKIITQFVGVPLAGSGRFDEVQLMFYKFNGKSGSAKNYPTIASFLVNMGRLDYTMTEYIATRPGLSIEGYINMLNNEVIGDPSSVNYGLTALQNQLSAVTESENESASEDEAEAVQNQVTQIGSDVTERLKAIYASGPPTAPIFTQPKLAMIFEALPAFVAKDGDSPFIPDKSKIVLRVHIFDTNATPHRDEMFLHNAMNDKELAVRVKAENTTDTSNSLDQDADESSFIPASDGSFVSETALAAGVIQNAGDPDSDEFKASPFVVAVSGFPNTEIKRIIKTTVPSMTFGLGFSALNSFSMQSTTGGAVGNTMLLNAITAAEKKTDNPTKSDSQTNNLEDITVIPANASIDLLGCPLLEYGQNFFVDLGTGTTADNLYYITSIEHTLTAGEFRTSATLSFSGSGTLKTFRSMLIASQAGLSEIIANASEPTE